jgi:hypothetical protein
MTSKKASNRKKSLKPGKKLKATRPLTQTLGSASTGSGAGKITFNG